MTNTKTKLAIASLLAATLASSAFASEGFTPPNSFNQEYAVQTTQPARTHKATEAYAQASSQNASFSNGENREFDRATNSALFDR